MKRVWFDHQVFSVQRAGGYTRYFTALARALKSLTNVAPQVVAPAHVCLFLDRTVPTHPTTFRLPWPKRGLHYRPATFAPLFRAAAELNPPDVVHETHFVLDGSHVPRKTKIVSTCHDMILEKFSDSSPKAREAIARKRKSFERSHRIVCVSHTTQQDLLNLYPHLSSRTTVIHHGVESASSSTSTFAHVPPGYILYVGARPGYKNFSRALVAWSRSNAFKDGVNLVCFGGGSLSGDERALLDELHVPADRIRVVNGDDSLLGALYRGAAFLLSPSEYEGFGMPLTEAMVSGCPVVCSSAPSYVEVCDSAARFFDPLDIDSMVNAIDAVAGSESVRRQLRELGAIRSTQFSWAKCAASTALCYDAL